MNTCNFLPCAKFNSSHGAVVTRQAVEAVIESQFNSQLFQVPRSAFFFARKSTLVHTVFGKKVMIYFTKICALHVINLMCKVGINRFEI